MTDVNLSRLKGALHDYGYDELQDLARAIRATLKEKREEKPPVIHYWRSAEDEEEPEEFRHTLCGLKVINEAWTGVRYKDDSLVTTHDYETATCGNCRRRDPGKLRRDLVEDEPDYGEVEDPDLGEWWNNPNTPEVA